MQRPNGMKSLVLTYKLNNVCPFNSSCLASYIVKVPSLKIYRESEYNNKETLFSIYRTCHTGTRTFPISNLTLNNSTNYLKKKIDDLVTKYEQVTGMDEVRLAQNRVIEAQDKFVSAQEKRREVVQELTVIQNKLKEVHAELDATNRGEER